MFEIKETLKTAGSSQSVWKVEIAMHQGRAYVRGDRAYVRDDRLPSRLDALTRH